jgi:hypothetical protein
VPHSREIRNTADLLTRPFCVQGVLNNVEVLELYQTAVLRNNETLRGLLRILVTFLSHSVREPWFSHCRGVGSLLTANRLTLDRMGSPYSQPISTVPSYCGIVTILTIKSSGIATYSHPSVCGNATIATIKSCGIAT